MDELHRQVRRARRRLGMQRFVAALGWCWLATLVAALGIIMVGKFWPLGVTDWAWVGGALIVGLAAAVGWAFFAGRGTLDAAIEIDRRFGLKERVSSTLTMSVDECQTEAGQALVTDAIRRVKDYIMSHYTDNISLNKLADISSLSSFRLLRAFQKSVGLPPYQFLINLRVKHAQILLEKGQSIAQSAYGSGFCHQYPRCHYSP